MISGNAVEAARDIIERITDGEIIGAAADEFARLILEAAAPHVTRLHLPTHNDKDKA